MSTWIALEDFMPNEEILHNSTKMRSPKSMSSMEQSKWHLPGTEERENVKTVVLVQSFVRKINKTQSVPLSSPAPMTETVNDTLDQAEMVDLQVNVVILRKIEKVGRKLWS